MTTKINGTNTAASPAITGADTDTGLSFGTDTVNINTGGVTRATVESNGRLGIGTTSPSYPVDIRVASGDANMRLRADGTGTGDDTVFRMQVAGTTQDNFIYFGDSEDSNAGYINYNHSSNFLRFFTDAGERMRITSTGGVCFATTALGIQNSNSASFNPSGYFQINHASGSSSGLAYVAFNLGTGEIGSITQNGTIGVSYNTSSDYRLKENVTAISDGITRLKTLKPSRFNFIADSETTVDGFLAHEVTAVPEAITGTKDETQDILYTVEDTIPSGKKVGDVKETVPKYQGIDQSKLVPLLTAALQEAVAKIEVLETKVAALEAA